jgi:hypothetical protein
MEVANIPGLSDRYLLLSKRKCDMMIPVGNPKSDSMTGKADVLQGTLALMALKTSMHSVHSMAMGSRGGSSRSAVTCWP